MAHDPPQTGWALAHWDYAPVGKHCDSCLGTTRVRWHAVPIVWTHHQGPTRPAPSDRYIHLCDFCTWPDGGLLTNACCPDGTVAVIRSSLRDRRIIVIPLNRWPQ